MNELITTDYNKFNAPITAEYDIILEAFSKSLDNADISKATYINGVKHFLDWLIQEGITEVQQEDILAYKKHLKDTLAISSAGTYLTSLKKLYNFLSTKGIKNLAGDIKGFKQSRTFKKDPLTPAQAKELLKVIDTNTITGKRDYAIINILIRNGLRTIEIERANIEDMRQINGQAVLYIQGKGRDSKDKAIVLTPITLKAIYSYLQARGKADPKEPLFISYSDRSRGKRLKTRTIRHIGKETLRAIGVDSERITTHSYRHTAITFCLLAGGSLQEAQELGRHADINTTLIYAHNLDRVAKAPERYVDMILEEV